MTENPFPRFWLATKRERTMRGPLFVDTMEECEGIRVLYIQRNLVQSTSHRTTTTGLKSKYARQHFGHGHTLTAPIFDFANRHFLDPETRRD